MAASNALLLSSVGKLSCNQYERAAVLPCGRARPSSAATIAGPSGNGVQAAAGSEGRGEEATEVVRPVAKTAPSLGDRGGAAREGARHCVEGAGGWGWPAPAVAQPCPSACPQGAPHEDLEVLKGGCAGKGMGGSEAAATVDAAAAAEPALLGLSALQLARPLVLLLQESTALPPEKGQGRSNTAWGQGAHNGGHSAALLQRRTGLHKGAGAT